jgi:hypothetical protein
MSTTVWLRRQLARLEEEIRTSPVFDSETPSSPEQLRALHEKVVLRSYLRQQLLRRARVDNYDTKEYELIPLPVEPVSISTRTHPTPPRTSGRLGR